MYENRIEIPLNDKGRRCIEVLTAVAMKHLDRAREAVCLAVADVLSDFKIIDEQAMCGGKYFALFATPYGEQRRVVYDYRTKEVIFEEVAA